MAKQNTAIAAASPPAPITRNNGLMATFAAKFNVDADKLKGALKATAFKTENGVEVTDEQLLALIVVSNQYGLNPFTKEIFAFPSQKGITPVVSVDGWIRIVNEHPQLASFQFRYAETEEANGVPAWIECVITRKDREAPIVIREYLAECQRQTGPWKSHPARMLRHKAFIQCARLAFGFAGIHDPDEAERIANAIDATPPGAKPRTEAPRARTDAQASIQGESSEVPAEEPTGEVLPDDGEAVARG